MRDMIFKLATILIGENSNYRSLINSNFHLNRRKSLPTNECTLNATHCLYLDLMRLYVRWLITNLSELLNGLLLHKIYNKLV